MKIILNNKPEQFEGLEKLTINKLLQLKKFTFKLLVVKINDRVIKKDDFDNAEISDGDNVAIIHLIAGG